MALERRRKDLSIPLSNQLEALKHDRKGQHSIRIGKRRVSNLTHTTLAVRYKRFKISNIFGPIEEAVSRAPW